MSSPQPPENQPGQGGGQPPQSGDPALANSGPTQVVQPGQPGATSEATQVVRPGQQAPGANPVPEATQVVQPGQPQPNYGQYASAVQPPAPGAPQQPGWSGAPQQPGVPGYGQQPAAPGYGQQPPGYGAAPGQPVYGQQPYQAPGQPAYGQQPGYGQPAYPGYAPGQVGNPPNTNQIISWVVLGVVAVMSLIAAILAIVDLSDLGSASSGASDLSGKICANDPALCASINQNIASATPSLALAWISVIVILLGSLAAIAGAVLLFLKKTTFAHFLIVGAGAALLIFSIIDGAKYEFAGSLVYYLITGLVLLGAGALAFFPQTRAYLGLPAVPVTGYGQAGGFGQQQQQPYGQQPYGGYQQQPAQQPGQYPQQQPGGYQQPGSGGFPQQTPPSGGFPQQQPGYGQPPQQPPQGWGG